MRETFRVGEAAVGHHRAQFDKPRLGEESGLIALLHRLGMEHRKPKAVSSKLDPDKQAAFIKSYENLLNHIGDDEAVLFGDAVHPTHAVRPVDAGRRKTPRSLWNRPAAGSG